MSKYFVLPHLGLGDQFIMNGFVHFLREQLNATNVLILAKEHQSATLAELYSGYPEVSFLTVKGDEEVFGAGNKQFLEAGRGRAGDGE